MAATALLAFIVGQLLTLDALFSAFLVASVAAFLEAVAARRDGQPARGWTLLVFGLLACALLTKGLAAVILTGGILVFSLPFAWKDRVLRRAVLRTALDPLGWACYLVLAAPWFILVDRANPGHAQFFFIHEHFTRFLTHEHARQGSNNWLLDKLYFVGILAVGLLPWLSAVLRGMLRAAGFVRRGGAGPQTEAASFHRWTVAVLLLSFAWPLLFFSVSGSKLPPYILPAIAPLAALAVAFEREGEELAALRRTGWELMALGLVFLAAGFAFQKDIGDAARWAFLPGAAFALLALWALRPRGLGSAGWMAALGACLWLVSFAVHRAAGPDKDVGPLVRSAPSQARWISFGVYYQGLPFHTGERCVVVAGTGELGFGRSKLSPAEAGNWLPDEREALLPTAQRMRSETPGRPIMILMKDRDWEGLPEADRGALNEVRRQGNNVLARLR
jgi:4-amino-4-deoxy-L-arabinose transferase-like glycosyltransferase